MGVQGRVRALVQRELREDCAEVLGHLAHFWQVSSDLLA
jgi:hypothetical protein